MARWTAWSSFPRHALLAGAYVIAALLASGAGAAPAAPSIAVRLDRAERMQDWAEVEKLGRIFVLSRRADLHAITSILDGCIARGCDVEAQVKRLKGPLVSEGVREFSRAWVEYVSIGPAAARPRFEALSRDPATAWLGAFGRLSYASDARNVALLREALRDARGDAATAEGLADDIATAEMSLASLEGDNERLASLARKGGDSTSAMMVRFAAQLAADEFDAAGETLRRYVTLHGEDQDAAMSRIELARATRPPAEVAREARAALAAHPRFWRLRFALAQALIESDEPRGGRAALDEGLPAAFAAVRLELAVVGAALTRFTSDNADEYARILEAWPDHPDALIALAGAMLDAGRAEDAAALLDRVDAMTPALPDTLNMRARMAREAGRADEYVQLLERAAAWTPREVNPQLALGLAYVKAGDTIKAARIAAALRRSPRYVRRESIESLEKAVRDAEPSFRTAALAP